MKKEKLYGWIITFNPFDQEYIGVTRENYMELFNGPKGNTLRDKTMRGLEKKIIENERVREINLVS